MLSTTVRLILISGRIAALVGAALTVFAFASWVIKWASASPLDWNVGVLPLVLPAQALVAAWLAWSAIKREGPALFRSAMLAFVVSFVLLYGWYFVLLWDVGAVWIASGNFTYLAAGLLAGTALLLSAVGARFHHDRI